MRIDPAVAPVWRRVTAGTVDATLVLAGYGGMIAGPAVWGAVRRRGWEGTADALLARAKTVLGEGEVGRRRSQRIDLATRVIRVLARNRATPGQRLLGVRRADAATGGPVPLRGALLQEVLRLALARSLRLVNKPRVERWKVEQVAARPGLDELRERLGDDHQAFAEAMRERARAEGRSCWTAMAPSCALALGDPLTMFLSPRRQTLVERIAGVVVLREGGREPPRHALLRA